MRLPVVLAGMLLCGCATGEWRTGAGADQDLLIGTIQLVTDVGEFSEDKSFVAPYRFAVNVVEPLQPRVLRSAGGLPRSESGDFRIALLDHNGEVLAQYTMRNPRRLLVERRGLIDVPEALYVARFPFHPRAREARVLDRKGKVLAVTDLLAAIEQFCAATKQDGDCRELAR